jgi:hypothetical protein
MKLVKMSLAAAVLLGASAFAIDNIKVSGDAKLFYGTSDIGSYNLFDKDSSYADTALRVGVTGDLLSNVSFGLTGYGVSTLGLENNLVSDVWTGAHTATGNTSSFGAQVNDEAWLGEAWMATTMGKTTAKIGRMQLDTPLAFSETWNIAPNTFEAAVLINQDIPNTTLIGAWIGKGNGGAGVVGPQGTFNTFVNDGAYAAAIVNNSYKPLTAQAWYYNVVNVADAYWLQADIDCSLLKGLKIGGQYADMDPKGILPTAAKSTDGYAFKLAYDAVENLYLSASYSDVDNDGILKIQNVATDLQGAAQSKLYTEAWWNYGYVGAPGAESYNLTAEYNVKEIAKFGAYYTNVDNQIRFSKANLNEFTLTATHSFGPLDATLAYISTQADDQNIQGLSTTGSQYNTVQAYLTLNF